MSLIPALCLLMPACGVHVAAFAADTAAAPHGLVRIDWPASSTETHP